MNKKLLLSFALAAAMAGCINDADVPSGNGDNPISGAQRRQHGDFICSP